MTTSQVTLEPTTGPGNTLATIEQPRGSMAGLALTSGINVMDTINKADIVAVVRQEAEESLYERKRDLDKQLNALEQEVSGIDALVNKIVQRIVADADLKDAREAAKSLAKFTGGKFTAEATLGSRDDEHQHVHVTITLSKTDAASYERKVGEKETKVPYTDEMIDHLRTIKGHRRNIQKLQIALIAIKKDLHNLPALERKAHAELAKVTLGKSDEGRQLLQRLRQVRTPVLSD